MNVENQPPLHHLAPTGTVLKVEHRPLSKEGEINTHILLKGHPLPVPHREEDLHATPNPQLAWYPDRCIYCQQCQVACPRGCLHQTEEGMEIDRDACTACGTCAKECPSMALEIQGMVTTAADLLHKTFKQNYAVSRKIRHVTIGGGEPGMQTAFCADLLFQLSAMGIPTTLQTSGTAPFEHYLPLIAYPARIEYELITTNPTLHQQITGYPNEAILDNLLQFAQEIYPATQLVIHTPLLPGLNTSEAQLGQTARWIRENLPRLPNWALFEPRYICEDASHLSEQTLAAIYRTAISLYPVNQVQLFNWRGSLVQLPTA